MPTSARKRHRIGTGGPWGSGLLLLGIATTAQGAGYLLAEPATLRSALGWIDEVVPVYMLGLLWIAAGVYSVWQALTPPQQHYDIAPAVAVICLWAAIYFAYWVYRAHGGDWTRDWTSALAWASLAAVLICFGRCNNPPTGMRR